MVAHTIDPDLLAAVDRVARRARTSRSVAIERLIASAIIRENGARSARREAA